MGGAHEVARYPGNDELAIKTRGAGMPLPTRVIGHRGAMSSARQCIRVVAVPQRLAGLAESVLVSGNVAGQEAGRRARFVEMLKCIADRGCDAALLEPGANPMASMTVCRCFTSLWPAHPSWSRDHSLVTSRAIATASG